MRPTDHNHSLFKSWSAFNVNPKNQTHPFLVVINLLKWLVLFCLTITFFWGLGTLMFNRWVNTGQVVGYEDGGGTNTTYVSGVFFEIDAGYAESLKFKRHVLHVNGDGNLFEYDYYQINNLDSAWHYSKSPFYVFLVLPTSWVLTKITKGLNWSSSGLGSNTNLTAMIVGIFLTTLILRLISGFGSFKQYKNKMKMESIQVQTKAIKEKYKDASTFEEKQKMQWEIMSLYRREKINPLSNSLEAFAFAPFLFAMFVVVRTSRILKDSGTSNFSFTTTLWEQVSSGATTYFIPVAVYLFLFVVNNVFLPRLLKHKKKQTNLLLPKNQGGRGAIFKWVFKLLFVVFFFIVPVGTSVYWTFSTFFEIVQKVVAFFWEKVDKQKRVAKKQEKKIGLWNLKKFDVKTQF